MPLETVTPATPAEPSYTELKAMLADPVIPAAEPPKPETPAENTEPESGTGKEKLSETVETEKEEELPPGVKSRIAKEVEKQARFDREINRAVAVTKAKQDELLKLKAGKPGEAPEKSTEPAEGAEPVEPDETTFTGTFAEFKAAKAEYRAQYKAWLEGETRKTVTAELTASQAKARRDQAWDKAAKEHGKEFPDLMKSLAEATPPELQQAISGLADWAGVAVHLAKPANAAERDALSAKIKTDPLDAYYDLRILEQRLKPAAKSAEKPLPAPLTPVAGAASATGAVDLDKPDRSYLALKREVEKALKN